MVWGREREMVVEGWLVDAYLNTVARSNNGSRWQLKASIDNGNNNEIMASSKGGQ